MARCVCAIDQGTTSTRAMIFDAEGLVLGSAQAEHDQILPRPGWVEHDAEQILDRVEACVSGAMATSGVAARDLAGIGITNQRETVVFWDRWTGRCVRHAIVWQDARTEPLCRLLASDGGWDRFRDRTGLPISTYFTGPKIRWAIEHDASVRAALRRCERGEPALVCGTIESWLIWNLTGGPDGGSLVTDATNASRTLLMDLERPEWSGDLLWEVGVPREVLPRVVASIPDQPLGMTRSDGVFGGEVPIWAALGDQQAALLGQGCLEPGQAKNTYGTGCFALQHTGDRRVASSHGLVTTVALARGGAGPRGERSAGGIEMCYALEGSIAVAGALVQWLRDGLGIIAESSEIESLARSTGDSGGVCIVPAFGGLLAPYWRPDARGVIVGLTRSTTRAHLARAALEATCFQTREVLDAMREDSGIELGELRVDGGMVSNDLLLQIQADVLGIPVVRPEVIETTSRGAGWAAGLGSGLVPDGSAIERSWREQARFEPRIGSDERASMLASWRRAVKRSLDLADVPDPAEAAS